MPIEKSVAFYKQLEKTPEFKNVFYQYSSLLGLCQYEQLFTYIAGIKDRESVKVLDWGCGNGWFTYYLLTAGFKNVVSYGYGWDSIEEAKRKVPAINYVNGAECFLDNPSNLPFENNAFDLVFSIGVLEHVHETGGDQLISLNEINRILKPGGTFFCYHLPNKLTWIEFTKGLFVKDKAKHFLHTKKFDEQDIKFLTKKSNFSLRTTKRYNLLPYNIFRQVAADRKLFVQLYNLFDIGLSLTPLNFFSQCYLFEARKENSH